MQAFIHEQRGSSYSDKVSIRSGMTTDRSNPAGKGVSIDLTQVRISRDRPGETTTLSEVTLFFRDVETLKLLRGRIDSALDFMESDEA